MLVVKFYSTRISWFYETFFSFELLKFLNLNIIVNQRWIFTKITNHHFWVLSWLTETTYDKKLYQTIVKILIFETNFLSLNPKHSRPFSKIYELAQKNVTKKRQNVLSSTGIFMTGRSFNNQFNIYIYYHQNLKSVSSTTDGRLRQSPNHIKLSHFY